MQNKPMRTIVIFREQEELYVLYYKGKQFYTQKEKIVDDNRNSRGYTINKTIYFSEIKAMEAIINFNKVYGLTKENFEIIKFVRNR